MKHIKDKKCYLFEDDDEFFEFAVDPSIKINTSEKGTPYFEWDFSNGYNKAVEDGITFDIDDEDSLIKKRGCITWKTVSKNVKNLKD